MSLHFYDGQIRRYLTQIIRMMSNFSYKDGDGDLRQVPVTYGDLTRQVASIMRDNSENKIPSAPRMAVYVTGLEMDRSRTSDSSYVSKVHIRERAYDTSGNEYLNTQGKNYTVERLMPTPYTLAVSVDIWTTNTDQKLQILEQILMLFNPSLEIQTTDNFVDWTSLSVINLESITFSSRSIPVGVDSEIDIATLGFSTPIFISPPAKVKRLGVITSIITSIFNEATGSIDLGISSGQGILENNNWNIREDRTTVGADGTVETTVDKGEFPNTGTGEMDFNVKRTFVPAALGSANGSIGILGLGLYIKGGKAYVIDKGEVGTVNWDGLFAQVPGCYTPGVSQIRISNGDGTYIIGYITVNPLDSTELIVEWDEDTFPANTVLTSSARNPNSYTSMDYIIDPLRWNPTTRLVVGLRLLILSKVGNDNNDDGADGWKSTNSPFGELVAGENDIIEWDGDQWNIIFNASESTDPIFITNLATGSQYKWTGEYWTKSFEGEYSQGSWALFP